MLAFTYVVNRFQKSVSKDWGHLAIARKKKTIKDIARLAEVSETTVSRFLNKKFEYMSEDTRNRIERIIKEVDYRPSNIARTLKSNQSKVFGAIIADIENPFSSLIIEGLINRGNELGYTFMISITDNSIEKEKEILETFLDNGVDGLAIQTVSKSNDYLKKVSEKVPVVLIDRNVTNFDADIVTSNNYDLGIQLMTHLKESGFKSFGFFSETIADNTVREDRYQAFSDSMEGHEGREYIIERSNTEAIVEKLEEFHTLPKPRVIVASNGLIQMTLLKVLKDQKYQLGKDVYFCGFDDYTWSSMIGDHGITSISQDSYGIGENSADLLYKRVTQKGKVDRGVRKEIEGQLQVRGTTFVD